jgi:hypothetical protein
MKPSITILLVLVIFWQGYSFISLRGFGWNVPTGGQPAVDFFMKNNLPEPIFNNFDIGSYLDFTLYPKEKVFIDGRPEAYPASFLQNTYIPMQTDQKMFEKIDNTYHFNTIFFAHTDQTPWAAKFMAQIMNNPQWKLVYIDSSVVILIKNNEQNKVLIQKFGMDQNTIRIHSTEPYSITDLMYLANLFINVGWTNQEVKIDKQIVEKDPTNCQALSRLATIMPTIYLTQLHMYCQ